MAFLAPLAVAVLTIGPVVELFATATMDATENAESIRTNIKDMKDKTKELNKQYSSIIDKSQAFNAKIELEMKKNIDDIAVISARIKENKAKFDEQQRKINMIGMLVVVSVFFMFILKRLGAFDLFS